MLTLSIGAMAQAQVTMDFVWVPSAQTSTTAEFDVVLKNTGTLPLTFNGIIIRSLAHTVNSTILTGGVGTISWKSVAGTAPASVPSGNGWNNWPNIATNLGYTTSTRIMNYSSNNTFFTSATAPTIPTGAGVNIGRFRITVTGGTFVTGTQFGFNWATTAAVIAYVNGATTTTSLATAGTNKIVTVSAQQPLGPAASGSTAAVMTGNATVCAGSSSNISVAITGGTSPYTLVYGDGTNSYTVNSYASGSAISVTPSTTSTYTITSVTDAGSNAGTGNSGSATVTVNQPSPSVVTGSVNNTQNQLDGTTMTYKSDCDLIGKIIDAAGGNTLGSTTMTSTLNAANPIGGQYGFTYCKRTFEVSPASNGSSNMTFYLTQADFNDFNANKPSWMTALPTSSVDPNSANIRVTKVSANGAHRNIFLSSSNFSWSANGYWQLAVNVTDTSAGTYYVTSTPDCTNEEVTGLTAGTPTATTVPLSWNAISGYGWFQVQYKMTSSGTWLNFATTAVGATSITVTGLSGGNMYDFRVVRVCSPTSLGNWTSPVTATTTAPVAIPCSLPPTNIVVSNPTGTSLTVSWTGVVNAGWYAVQYKTTAGNTWSTLTTGATSMVINGLMPNTSYDVQVKTFCNSLNSGMSSAYSATSTLSTVSLPCSLAPSNITVQTIAANTTTITWTAVPGAGWYGVRYKKNSVGTWTMLSSSTNSITLAGLSANTLYDVEVKTFCNSLNSGVSSAYSATTNFTTGLLPCTTAPTGLAMSAITATTATATWNAVAGYGWYGFKYRAQNVITPNAWISSTTTGPTRMMTGLVSGTTYEVSVKVFCNNNNAGMSSDWSDTTFNFTAGGQTKLSASVASNEVSVYPNPTSDELNIDVVMDNESMTTVKVMDMSGRVVKQIQASTIIGQNNIKISLAELTAGLYTIQIINNDKLMHVSRVSKN